MAQLEKVVGINLLTGVPQQVKDVAAHLPRPTPHNERDGTDSNGKRAYGPRSGAKDEYRLNAQLLRTVEEFLKLLKR